MEAEQEEMVLFIVWWWYSHPVLVYMTEQGGLICWTVRTPRSHPSQVAHHLVVNVLMIIVSLLPHYNVLQEHQILSKCFKEVLTSIVKV